MGCILMTITNESITNMRKEFLSKTSTLRKQIDNKKAKIESEQKTLRNHQKRFDEQVEDYKNEVNNIITQLVLKQNVDPEEVKKIYSYLMNFNPAGEQSTDKHSETYNHAEPKGSSSDNVSLQHTSERADNQNHV